MDTSQKGTQGTRTASSKCTADAIFGLSYHHLGQRTESTNCLLSLMSLRTHCLAEPLKAATMQNFLHIWDRNMMEPSADAVSQQQLQKLFYESVEHCQYGEVQTEIKFYKELPESQQTQSELRRRIDKVLRKKEALESRKAHENYLNDQLSLGAPPHKQQRGNAAKEQRTAQRLSPRNSPPRATRMQKVGGMGGKMQTTK